MKPLPAGAGSKGRLPGIYALMFHLDGERRIAVGRLGSISFPTGWYAYVGSAMAGLERRLRHHLRYHKHPHWHIDYLLPKGALTAIIVGSTPSQLECALASTLSRCFRVFHRFGSSDCRFGGHLFHADSLDHLNTTVIVALTDLGCAPAVIWASPPKWGKKLGTEPQRQEVYTPGDRLKYSQGRTTRALILPLLQGL